MFQYTWHMLDPWRYNASGPRLRKGISVSTQKKGIELLIYFPSVYIWVKQEWWGVSVKASRLSRGNHWQWSPSLPCENVLLPRGFLDSHRDPMRHPVHVWVGSISLHFHHFCSMSWLPKDTFAGTGSSVMIPIRGSVWTTCKLRPCGPWSIHCRPWSGPARGVSVWCLGWQVVSWSFPVLWRSLISRSKSLNSP